MQFSKDVARKKLSKHMFAGLKQNVRKKRIDAVIKGLSSVKQFQVHSRMINANAAKATLNLKVKIVPKDDPYWKDIWHYYVRTQVFLARTGFSKLVESRAEQLVMGRTQ